MRIAREDDGVGDAVVLDEGRDLAALGSVAAPAVRVEIDSAEARVRPRAEARIDLTNPAVASE
jgi:hypothetical protein